MKRVCVFCGSNSGAGSDFVLAARQLGAALAERSITLVYGGASVGTMGEIANAVLEKGGEAIGVIPSVLMAKEIAHTGLSELRTVGSMHERKALMAELSDGFIALPGGLGTLEEFFEIITWAMLGMHTKPCGILNINGYYNKLIDFLDLAVKQQFIKHVHRSMILVDTSPDALLDRFDSYRAPQADKWINIERT
jgi:uncharacterized protein (TIGR00730 family)